MILILMGPPGSGKGTQAEKLVEHFHLYHLTTGGMLREEEKNGTAIGAQVGPMLASGQLAPNEIVQRLVRDRIAKTGGNVLFDGYPRNPVQVEDLDEILGDLGERIDAIIFLDVPEEVAKQRIAGRLEEAERLHKPARQDDQPDRFPTRWEEYNKVLEAMKAYQGKPNFFRLDGTQGVELVFAEICNVLERVVGKQHSGL